MEFITGAPGSGKTAITNVFSALGYTIYDTDDPHHTGMAGWHNLETGEYVAGFNELDVTPDLLETHIWKLTDTAFEDFRERSKTEQIFLCGRLRDARTVINASRHVLFLTVSGETIAKRLANRAKIPGEVEWGREPWQIARSIEVNAQIEEEYRQLGATIIRADQPLPAVVSSILAAAK